MYAVPAYKMYKINTETFCHKVDANCIRRYASPYSEYYRKWHRVLRYNMNSNFINILLLVTVSLEITQIFNSEPYFHNDHLDCHINLSSEQWYCRYDI